MRFETCDVVCLRSVCDVHVHVHVHVHVLVVMVRRLASMLQRPCARSCRALPFAASSIPPCTHHRTLAFALYPLSDLSRSPPPLFAEGGLGSLRPESRGPSAGLWQRNRSDQSLLSAAVRSFLCNAPAFCAVARTNSEAAVLPVGSETAHVLRRLRS